jgi:hypothetical protein
MEAGAPTTIYNPSQYPNSAGAMHLVAGQHSAYPSAPNAAFHGAATNVPSVISAVSDIHKRDKELIYR